MAVARWDETDAETLRRMWTVEGKSAAVIAAAIGRGLTRNAVMGKITRMGLLGKKANAKPRRKADGGVAFV